MIIAGLDIETTGLLAPDHRIVEIYIGLWKDKKRIWQYEQRINPERAISADAQRVHGISINDLFGMPTWNDVAPIVYKILSRADLLVAHNGNEFDLPFIKKELERVGLKMPEKPSVDTMLEGTWATSDGKKPRLGELAFACGIEYDPTKAHAASYDVEVMMDCFFKARKWGFMGSKNIQDQRNSPAAVQLSIV